MPVRIDQVEIKNKDSNWHYCWVNIDNAQGMMIKGYVAVREEDKEEPVGIKPVSGYYRYKDLILMKCTKDRWAEILLELKKKEQKRLGQTKARIEGLVDSHKGATILEHFEESEKTRV